MADDVLDPHHDTPGQSQTEVLGLTCQHAEHYPDGRPEYCLLAKQGTLTGQVFAAGTGVHFNEYGEFDWCLLQQDTEIQGVKCRGDGHGFMTEFHPNGKLKRAYLAEDQEIQQVPCARFRFWSAVFWPIHGKSGGTDFHSNGRLSACELSRRWSIDSRNLSKGTIVRFSAEGRLLSPGR